MSLSFKDALLSDEEIDNAVDTSLYRVHVGNYVRQMVEVIDDNDYEYSDAVGHDDAWEIGAVRWPEPNTGYDLDIIEEHIRIQEEIDEAMRLDRESLRVSPSSATTANAEEIPGILVNSV